VRAALPPLPTQRTRLRACNFSPSILPVHQYVDWVQYSSYADGAFALEWREDFDSGALPAGWLTGSWASPKNNSIHNAGNVNVLDGYLVLSLTADDAIGPAGAMPEAPGGSAGSPGAAGAAGAPPSSTAGDDGGCSVAAARSGRSGVLCTALVLGALAVLGRRRRSPQRRSLASAASS
jgi:hypothetical protein